MMTNIAYLKPSGRVLAGNHNITINDELTVWLKNIENTGQYDNVYQFMNKAKNQYFYLLVQNTWYYYRPSGFYNLSQKTQIENHVKLSRIDTLSIAREILVSIVLNLGLFNNGDPAMPIINQCDLYLSFDLKNQTQTIFLSPDDNFYISEVEYWVYEQLLKQIRNLPESAQLIQELNAEFEKLKYQRSKLIFNQLTKLERRNCYDN